MKRYAIFGFDTCSHKGVEIQCSYYPNGGFNDFVYDFHTLDEAKEYVERNRATRDSFHIVDTVEYMIVAVY